MRLLSLIVRWTFVALIIAVACWGLARSVKNLPTTDPQAQEDIAAAAPTIAYVLDRTRWLSFVLPAGTNALRIVTNANLPASVAIPGGTVHAYAFEYQVLDDRGRVLVQRQYHHRAGLTRFGDTSGETDTGVSAAFYLGLGLRPLDAKVMSLNLAGLAGVKTLRLRLAKADPPLMDVVLRASYREPVPERRLGYLWQRLSEEQKQRLAQANVYTQDLLVDQEIRNLLREDQRPLGPEGVAEQDYQSRTLYVLREIEGAEIADPIPPAGLPIGPSLRATVPIPETGGQVRLDFKPSSIVASDKKISGLLKLRWYGRDIHQRLNAEIAWEASGLSVTQDLGGGLLEIETPQDSAVRAYLPGQDKPLEITPPASLLRTYITAEATDLTFRVSHLDRQTTPFRIDLRRLLPLQPTETGTSKAVAAELQMRDATGQVLREVWLTTPDARSSYDRLQATTVDTALSDPITYYFALPLPITQLRLKSALPLLVAAYNRPAELVHESKLPEDSYASEAWRQPAWFPLKPERYEQWILANRSVLIAVQQRPPEDKPALLAGQYLWEDYHPDGDWLGRYLLTPAEDTGSIREEAWASSYRPLPAGNELELDLRLTSATGPPLTFSPSLIYLRDSAAPMQIEVYRNGTLHHRTEISGTRGELRLPPLPAGRQRLRIAATASSRFFINYAKPVAGSLLKRLANRLQAPGLDFDYERRCTCEETLSLRLHVPFGTRERTRLRVQIAPLKERALGPLSDWSFDARRYDLRPDSSVAVPVLNTPGDQADRGQSFFLPLGADLPPGTYRLRFTLEQGPGGYLSLARITPGTFEQRQVLTTSETRETQISE